MVKKLPANSRGSNSITGTGNPLEEEMTTCSSILAGRILRTEESSGLQHMIYWIFLRIFTGNILLAQFDIKICLEKVQLHGEDTLE